MSKAHFIRVSIDTAARATGSGTDNARTTQSRSDGHGWFSNIPALIFDLEAVTALPNPGSAAEINNWFWDETAAGDLLMTLRDRLKEHADAGMKRHARLTLVSEAQLARKKGVRD